MTLKSTTFTPLPYEGTPLPDPLLPYLLLSAVICIDLSTFQGGQKLWIFDQIAPLLDPHLIWARLKAV